MRLTKTSLMVVVVVVYNVGVEVVLGYIQFEYYTGDFTLKWEVCYE